MIIYSEKHGKPCRISPRLQEKLNYATSDKRIIAMMPDAFLAILT